MILHTSVRVFPFLSSLIFDTQSHVVILDVDIRQNHIKYISYHHRSLKFKEEKHFLDINNFMNTSFCESETGSKSMLRVESKMKDSQYNFLL